MPGGRIGRNDGNEERNPGSRAIPPISSMPGSFRRSTLHVPSCEDIEHRPRMHGADTLDMLTNCA
jgi:hypothetical protein